MGEILAPLRASLAQVARRRSPYVLLGLFLLIVGATSYSSYQALDRQSSPTGPFGGLRSFSTTCDENECIVVGPDGRPLGPPIPYERYERSFGRSDVEEFFGPQLETLARERRAQLEAEFSTRSLLRSRIRTIGTLWGVFFAIGFASNHIASEWRWRTWRGLLTHEPRRARVLVGKLGALWLLVAIGFLVAVGFTVGFDAVVRAIKGVAAPGGGPGTDALAADAGRGILGLCVYATFGAFVAHAMRSGLLGLAAPLVFVLAEGLTTSRYPFLRAGAPHQQVAALLPHTGSEVVVGPMWWGQVNSRIECVGFGRCQVFYYPPITQTRATLVLAAWLIGLTLLAIASFRARDIPG